MRLSEDALLTKSQSQLYPFRTTNDMKHYFLGTASGNVEVWNSVSNSRKLKSALQFKCSINGQVVQVAATDDLTYVFATGQRTMGKKTVFQTTCFRNLEGWAPNHGAWTVVRIVLSSLGPVFYGAKQKEIIKVDFSTK